MWDDVIRYALAHETPWPRDLRAHLEAGFFEAPPYNEILGPVRPRGGPNGLVLRGGAVVARWGDTGQADFTFSVAKSYLSLLAGVAVADGLIADIDDPVRRTVDDGGFDGPHNGAITWRHLLQQTSEWEGTLFGKSDIVDRNRSLAMEGKGRKGDARPLRPPGTFWEYNDVRVNRLALALLRVFRRPLPEVFAERIMRPIGASDDWSWHGYRTSMVEIDGRWICSVSGGSHWGGGVAMHAEDQARIGLLMLHRGVWQGRRLLPESWIAESLRPCALHSNYGLLWWLNTGRARYPAASEASFFASGAGGNIIWIDPTNDLVGVMRWMDPASVNGFIGLVMEASCAARAAPRQAGWCDTGRANRIPGTPASR
jgi:CubicO group peptidase (beta-lactamase class C family)